ncbi:MAG: intradiol ring-cleavage dioxygenase [Anaerolineae bacterium]|nr:intradiol ring-cleavage dioxygenase [Anaerolineae bacterium]
MELHDDDQPVGRVLTRREILALLGGAGAAAVVATGFTRLGLDQLTGTATPQATVEALEALPACVVRPALTEGPYFVDEMLNRSDIRIEPSDGSIQEGAPLHLIFKVSDVSQNRCAPLAGAQVDVWHCDAQGRYSEVDDPGFDTSGQTWLRGYQVTDESGTAEFMTIYPGWYSGRTVHIHFKIRTDPESEAGYEFTSQLFFPEDVTDLVHAQPPYASKGYRNTLNASDSIFRGSDGLLTLDVVEVEADAGYEAVFGIGLDLSQPSPAESSMGGPGGGRPSSPPPSNP